ncbi:hypothetical protein SND41_02540, partial [Escherichia coli]|nr:hypothetical protein [Escherichia coli]
SGAGGDFLCALSGDRQEKGGDFPRHRHHFRIFARASAMLRISSRASKKTPAEYSGQRTTAAWRLQIVVWQNMSFQSNH